MGMDRHACDVVGVCALCCQRHTNVIKIFSASVLCCALYQDSFGLIWLVGQEDRLLLGWM